MSNKKRSSGILLPISALPSQFGIGSLGKAAKQFVKEIREAGQSYWQILPLTIPDFVNSPYASPSAFAGNYWLIDIDSLVSDRLIDKSSADFYRRGFFKKVDYNFVREVKSKLFESAYSNFLKVEKPQDYYMFLKDNELWLDNYLLYISAKEYFGDRAWYEWDDEGLRNYESASCDKYREMLAQRMDYHRFLQYIFYSQLDELKRCMDDCCVELIGDLPFYVSYDSADVWANGELFLLDEKRSPQLVAGVPPDFFSDDGQLWGNPIYNFDKMKENGYRWFIERFEHSAMLYDVVRIDHFRAFDTYYTVEYGKTNACTGEWKTGIGYDFFAKLYEKNPNIRLIAEDLGNLFESVGELRGKCGLPGMRVVQFAFDSDADNDFLTHNYTTDSIGYLGTHDNNTVMGWLAECPVWLRKKVLAYVGSPDCDLLDDIIREKLFAYLSSSVAQTVIFTVQDILAQSSEYRINTPSKIGGCWEYMVETGQINQSNLAYLKYLTILYGRENRECKCSEDSIG